MALSQSELGGERVGVFVMSVIEAVSPSGSSVARGNRRVSRYPIPPSPSPPLTTKSQSSQELVEDSLGSLTTLLSISSKEFRQGSNGAITVFTKSSNVGKVHAKKKEALPPRKNILRRKKSSLKALSPEDLGRVSKSPPHHEVFSPPSVVVTLPSSSSSPSPQEKYFNDRGEKVTAATSTPSKNHHNSSTSHLKRATSNSRNNSHGNDKGRVNNSHNNFSLNNHQMQKSETEIANSTSALASAGGTTIKDITNRVAGQRSPNYTDSKVNPTSSQLLHNNCNTSSDNTTAIGASQKETYSINKNAKDRQERRDNGSENRTEVTAAGTGLQENVDIRCCADAAANKGMRQKPCNQADDDYHGRMCIHHHHHHSHHHHYHYYGHSKSEEKKHTRSHHYQRSSFNPSNNQGDADDMGLDQRDNINGSCESIPQHQNYLHDHSHSATMLIQKDVHSSSPAEKLPKSPPPSHEYSLDDISFYRKFSATSPLPNLASRNQRSKSLLAWPGTDVHLNDLNRSTGKRSRQQNAQKSRSTPVGLNVVGLSQLSDPSLMHIGSVTELNHPYGCKCGGCLFCCNELACDCCCDECCCARQFSHMSADNCEATENNEAHNSNVKEWKGGKRGSLHHDKATSKNQTSRSVESILSLLSNDVLVFDDNDPDSFINAHFLHHLEVYESDEDDDEDVEEENQDDSNPSTNHNGNMDNADTSSKVQFEREQSIASQHGHHDDETKLDCKNITTTNLAAVVEKSIRRESGSSSRMIAATIATEPVPSRRNMNIVIVKESPRRSSVHPDGDTWKNNGGGIAQSRRQHRSASSTVIRTANGEIRSSPIIPLSIRQPSSNSSPGNSNEACNDGVVTDEQTQRSAVMTVTVDTMSLFLDAVHLQMNQA